MKQIVFRQIPVEDSADTYENIIGLIEYLEQGFEIISAVPTAGSVQYILTKDVTPPKLIERIERMDNENVDKTPNVPQELMNLRIQMCDYLFERGHRISKPLVDAAAQFAYDYGKALYEQGKLATPPIKGKD